MFSKTHSVIYIITRPRPAIENFSSRSISLAPKESIHSIDFQLYKSVDRRRKANGMPEIRYGSRRNIGLLSFSEKFDADARESRAQSVKHIGGVACHFYSCRLRGSWRHQQQQQQQEQSSRSQSVISGQFGRRRWHRTRSDSNMADASGSGEVW